VVVVAIAHTFGQILPGLSTPTVAEAAAEVAEALGKAVILVAAAEVAAAGAIG
jgi:hypothetical protein